ncbi:hypothetical protein M8494_17400 [Serratia ureilytica]
MGRKVFPKNIKEIAGKLLIAWSIEQALNFRVLIVSLFHRL